jgi:hypothetical protein
MKRKEKKGKGREEGSKPKIRVEPGLKAPAPAQTKTNEPINAMKDENPDDTVAAPVCAEDREKSAQLAEKGLATRA